MHDDWKMGTKEAEKARVVLSIGKQRRFSGWLLDLVTLPLVPHIIAAVCFCCLLLVTSWLWVESHQRFPRLSAGTYAGELRGVLAGEDSVSAPILIESLPSGELLFLVCHPGWRAERVTLVAFAGSEADAEWAHPVVVVGPDSKLRFTGTGHGDEGWSGEVKDLTNGRGGSWNLKVAPEAKLPPGGPSRLDLQLWVRLKSELADAEAQILALQARVPEQRREIEKLTRFVTEGDGLRARADEKYQAATGELRASKEQLKSRQEEAKGIERKLVLSESVTPRGKLTSLARATLDREARWIDSLLRTGAPVADENLELEVERGRAILRLKEQIDAERERILYLRGLQGGPAQTEPARSTFDSFWRW